MTNGSTGTDAEVVSARAEGNTDHAWTTTPPPDGGIGAELTEFDPRAVDEAGAAEIRRLVYEHKLVVLREQDLAPPQYIDLARRLGEPQIYFQPNYHHPDHPEIFVSSNRPMNGRKVGVAGTGRYWHTDYQFFPEPLPMTMVYPQQLPNANRETFYVDMERVLDTFPTELRERLETLRCYHQAKWRYKVTPDDIDKSITEILEEFGAETPTVTHPTIIHHPVNGRSLLYVSEGFTVGFVGLEHRESRALLRQVIDLTQREENVHRHPWREGDILLWDNRQVIHKASNTPPGQPSVSFRIGVYDGQPFYSDEARGRLEDVR